MSDDFDQGHVFIMALFIMCIVFVPAVVGVFLMLD